MSLPPPILPHTLQTISTPLTSDNGYDWTLSCTADPQHANILSSPAHRHPASVPGSLFADLSTLLPDPFLYDNNLDPVFTRLEHASFRYQACFFLTSTPPITSPLLILEGVDTVASVQVNNTLLLNCENAFHPHTAVLSSNILRTGQNILTVDFEPVHTVISRRDAHKYREWNDPVGGISCVRTPQFLAGWDWGPRLLGCGLVRSPRLVFAPMARLLDVACMQRISFLEDDNLHVQVKFKVALAVNEDDSRSDDISTHCLFQPSDLRMGENDPSRQRTSLQQINQETDSGMWTGGLKDTETVLFFEGTLDVYQPKLWWPNGMGIQHLYQVQVFVALKNNTLDSKTFNIGLRKLELIREKTPNLYMHGHEPNEKSTFPGSDNTSDKPKESFMFSVNNRRFFSKGANYIPLHILYSETTKHDYDNIIKSVCQANMNMLRIWGGGVYETDSFYNLCDRYGILLWHDFMFSCSLYPADEEFLNSCRIEAQFQVSRLRNHPCMALWCGNNELEQVPQDILAILERKKAYDSLFYDVLPSVVSSDPGDITYWPSSPHNPQGYERGFNNPNAGDTHFWDVWHARKPLSSYLRHSSRFCSEFGMQSYLSLSGVRKFAGYDVGVLNPYGPVLEAHQKNASGNLIIQEYCQRLFRMPSGYAAIAYQSQLNQMICMSTGVEHFRRSWPYCGGALYWQLNDCWPCFSWSSIEYGGNWKALHYGAQRFFAPLLVTAVHHGDENVGVCNLVKLSEQTGVFSVYASYDGIDLSIDVNLVITVVNTKDSQVEILQLSDHTLQRDTSVKLTTIDARGTGQNLRNPQCHVLRVELRSCDEVLSSSTTAWFCSPRICELSTPNIEISVIEVEVKDTRTAATIRVLSDCFAPYVELSIDERMTNSETKSSPREAYNTPKLVNFSQNYFDIFKEKSVTVAVEIQAPVSRGELESQLRWKSITNSYLG